MRQTFFVPVRSTKAGALALQTGRLRSGERVGLAFTSADSLRLTLGPSQEWTLIGARALKDMLLPLGVEQVRVDPRPVAELGKPSLPRRRRPAQRTRSGRRARRAGLVPV